MSRGVVSVIYIPWSPSYARRRPLSDRYKYTRYIYKYEYNKNGILQRQIYRYKYTNTKSVDTHCMKEEAFWVVGKGKKEDLIGGMYKGSSINYVITFGGLGRPPPPYVIL